MKPGGSTLVAAVPMRTAAPALILVVERDPHIKKQEQFFLEQAGFSVEFANDGTQALERARVLHSCILVTEIIIPGLDGLNVRRALKSDPVTRKHSDPRDHGRSRHRHPLRITANAMEVG